MRRQGYVVILLILMLLLLWLALGVDMRRDMNDTTGSLDPIPSPTPTATEGRPALPPLETAPPLPTIPNLDSGGGKER